MVVNSTGQSSAQAVPCLHNITTMCGTPKRIRYYSLVMDGLVELIGTLAIIKVIGFLNYLMKK